VEGNKTTNPDRTSETIQTLKFIGYKLQTNVLILYKIDTTAAVIHVLVRIRSFDTIHTIERFSCKNYSLVLMIYCLFRIKPYITYTETPNLTIKNTVLSSFFILFIILYIYKLLSEMGIYNWSFPSETLQFSSHPFVLSLISFLMTVYIRYFHSFLKHHVYFSSYYTCLMILEFQLFVRIYK
jgi:hypothetical protein